MPRIPDNNQMQWEPVGLPLARGVDLRTPGRAIPQQRLSVFENGRFDSADAGLRRRRGHKAYTVSAVRNLVAAVDNNTPDQWVFGTGLTDDGVDIQHPWAGKLCGLAKRDTEVLAWDGFRMFSYPPGAASGQWQTPTGAVLPSARTTPIAKAPVAQKTADLGVGTRLAVVAWIDQIQARVVMSVFDATTWAPLRTNYVLSPANPALVRVVPAGDFVHVLVSTATTLDMFSVHADTPSTVNTGLTALGACNTYFDCRRVSDARWIVVKRDSSNLPRVTYLKNSGATDDTHCSANTLLDTSPVDGHEQVVNLAIASHAEGDLCLVWRSNASAGHVYGGVYTANGVRRGGRVALDTAGTLYEQVTVAPYYANPVSDPLTGKFHWFAEDVNGTAPYTIGATFSTAGVGTKTKRFWTELSHHAIGAGDAVFVGLRHKYLTADASKLQVTCFIADTDLKPVGMLERGTAANTSSGLASLHFYDGEDAINRRRFHGVVVYRQRLDSANNDQYDEESLKLLELDFMPRLRCAQLGRTLYIAGAQLSQYDGQQVVEAGQQVFPENVTTVDGGAGLLNGTYRWRARWAWKNAQGEEEVSATLTTAALVVTNRQITITVRTQGMTRKEGAYLLLYRNEASGTQWFLITSRDPTHARFVKNDPTVATVTFTDNLADNTILSLEKDRLDSGKLEPFPGTACEVIAAGRDRLWLAGGEIARGDVLPSLLYTPGGCAEFNGFLQTTIDRGFEPITAFAFMGNSTLVFKESVIYAFEADGPNNVGLGSFDMPRVVAADTGAVSQASVALSTVGVFFQSVAGIQLLATNYQVINVGEQVYPEVVDAEIIAAVVVPAQREIRFYRTDGAALVYFYSNNEWGTWPGLEAVGAVLDTRTGCVVLGRESGVIWVETPGTWDDGGRGYEMVARTAVLSRGLMQGAQRLRRVALLGDVYGDCTLTYRVYMDDEPNPADEWHWDLANGDLNTTTLGSPPTLGDTGTLGDADVGTNDIGVTRQRVLGDRHRVKRQKCARFSVEVRDGAPHNEGVGLTEMAFELGARGGLTRLPPREHTA